MADSVMGIGEEKRRYDRLNKSYKVLYRGMADIATPSAAQEGVVIDVGGGGLSFLAGQPIEKGSQLVLLVEFTGWVAQDNGDWVVTHNDSDVAELEVVAEVIRYTVSASVPGRFEIGVRFRGRVK